MGEALDTRKCLHENWRFPLGRCAHLGNLSVVEMRDMVTIGAYYLCYAEDSEEGFVTETHWCPNGECRESMWKWLNEAMFKGEIPINRRGAFH